MNDADFTLNPVKSQGKPDVFLEINVNMDLSDISRFSDENLLKNRIACFTLELKCVWVCLHVYMRPKETGT